MFFFRFSILDAFKSFAHSFIYYKVGINYGFTTFMQPLSTQNPVCVVGVRILNKMRAVVNKSTYLLLEINFN